MQQSSEIMRTGRLNSFTCLLQKYRPLLLISQNVTKYLCKLKSRYTFPHTNIQNIGCLDLGKGQFYRNKWFNCTMCGVFWINKSLRLGEHPTRPKYNRFCDIIVYIDIELWTYAWRVLSCRRSTACLKCVCFIDEVLVVHVYLCWQSEPNGS